VLVEVHSRDELHRALDAGATSSASTTATCARSRSTWASASDSRR
jgi:hypothetical protein